MWLKPDFAAAHHQLAVLLDQTGCTTDARHHFRQAIKCGIQEGTKPTLFTSQFAGQSPIECIQR